MKPATTSGRAGAAFAALTVVAVLTAACGGSTAATGAGTVALDGLRAAEAPPAYWLGERFEGLPLTANAGGVERPTFVYGSCEIPPGSDGGCAPPLALQHWPLAERSPNRFQAAPGQRASCSLLAEPNLTAAIFETTGGVEVYLGDRVVVLFGERDLIRKALRELRPLKLQQPTLPPPPAWVHDQLHRCAPSSPEAKIRELRAVAGSDTYWLGRAFEGHPLATAEGDAEQARLLYGDCAGDAFAFDQACYPPLEVQIGPIEIPGSLRMGHDCGSDQLAAAHGVPALVFADADTLVVFAGERTVSLIGPDLELLRRAADALRPLEESKQTGKLPAPPSAIVRELRARCR